MNASEQIRAMEDLTYGPHVLLNAYALLIASINAAGAALKVLKLQNTKVKLVWMEY